MLMVARKGGGGDSQGGGVLGGYMEGRIHSTPMGGDTVGTTIKTHTPDIFFFFGERKNCTNGIILKNETGNRGGGLTRGEGKVRQIRLAE